MSSILFYCQKEPIPKIVTHRNSYSDSTIRLGNFVLERELTFEEIPLIFVVLRKHWFELQLTALYGSNHDLINARKELNKCFQLIVEIFQRFGDETSFSEYRSKIVEKTETCSSIVLQLSDLDSEIYLKFSACDENCLEYQFFHSYLEVQYYLLLITELSDGNLDETVEKFMRNFVFLSKKSFIINNKSFYCNCVKNFCIVLQYFTSNFWEIFNKVVENEENDLTLWLLKEIAIVSKENLPENYKLLESTLKKVLESTNADLTQYLAFMHPLACDLWRETCKIELYQSLWDYYSKRLNFGTTHPHFTTLEYLNLIENVWHCPLKCEDFALFVGMLINHLKKHDLHWGKIKGRIYSQLGPNKIRDLNSAGSEKVSTLFFGLLKINFEEATNRILAFFTTLPQDKRQSDIIWSIYAAFIIQHLKGNRSIDRIVPLMLDMLEEASKENSFLTKQFIQDFDLIVKCNKNLQLNQSQLLNSWLNKYISSCYHHDLVSVLAILLNTLEKVCQMGVWSQWEDAYINHVYCSLKQISNTVNLEIVGGLAAKIALQSPKLLSEAFALFTADLISTKISSGFLCAILENYPNCFVITSQQEAICLQTWLKTCLLSKPINKKLTRNIIKLDGIPQDLKIALENSDDPVYTLIDFLAENKSSKLCEICFARMDSCINHCLTQPDNDAVLVRVYWCLATAFHKIGHLLYQRYKANCIFTRLVSIMLLPTEVMRGIQINPLILNCVRNTWHIYFEAFTNLSSTSDPFMQRTVRDFIIKYINYFSVVESPLISCLNNESSAYIILDKLSNTYLKHPSQESDGNVLKCLRILNECTQKTRAGVLKIIIDKTLFGLCEMVMLSSHKNAALAVIQTITSRSIYEEVRDNFRRVLLSVTERHLPFNYVNYFQLMAILVKFIPADLRILGKNIREQVCTVERMRGVGFDKNLRLHLERFEALL